jgi:serine/threonine protein phosphatase PrpC
MDKCEQTLLYLLKSCAGYDTDAPYANKVVHELANNSLLQHHINALETEFLKCLENKNTSILKRIKGPTLLGKRPRATKNVQLKPRIIKLRIPNLTVGNEFDEKIVFIDQLQSNFLFFKPADIPGQSNVAVDLKNLKVSGIITIAGDYEIKLFGHLLRPDGIKEPVVGILKITAIADPRSLWKNIPSDCTARFHKPDENSASCATELVTLIGSSVRGRSHAHKGIHRDDDFQLYSHPSSDWNVLCVADGAGSCKYSRQGSFLASSKSTSTLRETLNGHYGIELEKAFAVFEVERTEANHRKLQEIYQHTIVKAVFDAVKSIQETVEQSHGDSFKDFSTTLLLAAHKQVAGGHLVISFWIGDGGAVIYEKNKQVILLGKPDSGEFAGQTRFLDKKLFADGSIYSRIRIEKVTTMTAIILATDGITDAWFNTEKQLENIEVWDKLWEQLEPIVCNKDLQKSERELTDWMGFWSQGNHDDRTIALCTVKDETCLAAK